MGLGALGIATVSAECGRVPLSAFIINCQAPDEGNMHTLLHFATPMQREKYLVPLCNGVVRSCFAMTEPEVAGSDPTGIQTARRALRATSGSSTATSGSSRARAARSSRS